jgi:hypothetical protein
MHEVPDAAGMCRQTRQHEMPQVHFKLAGLLLGWSFAKGGEEGDEGSSDKADEIFGSSKAR